MFTRILIPTDFSEPSSAALEYAKAIATRFNASLHLIHVVDPMVTGMFGAEGYVPQIADSAESMQEEAEKKMLAFLAGTHSATTSIVVHGSAASAICDQATRDGTDLIVMGTHGRTGLTHMLLGSVAERVVRSAPCPVLTVHATPVVAADPLPNWTSATA